jgi:hypothetical protein
MTRLQRLGQLGRLTSVKDLPSVRKLTTGNQDRHAFDRRWRDPAAGAPNFMNDNVNAMNTDAPTPWDSRAAFMDPPRSRTALEFRRIVPLVPSSSTVCGESRSQARVNDPANSASMARLPFSWSDRVPVPVKCGWVIAGAAPRSSRSQSSPVQRNQVSFA